MKQRLQDYQASKAAELLEQLFDNIPAVENVDLDSVTESISSDVLYPDTRASTVYGQPRLSARRAVQLAIRRNTGSLLSVIPCPCVLSIFVCDSISECGTKTRRVEHQNYLDAILTFKHHQYNEPIYNLGIMRQDYQADNRSTDPFFHYDAAEPVKFFRRFFFFIANPVYLNGQINILYHDEKVVLSTDKKSEIIYFNDLRKYLNIVFDFIFCCYDFDDNFILEINALHFNNCTERF